jgi:hypothetical protein
MKRNKNALEQLLRKPSPNYIKCEKWSDETIKRVKTWDDKNKSRGGWRNNSEPVEKKKHLNYQERTNTNV